MQSNKVQIKMILLSLINYIFRCQLLSFYRKLIISQHHVNLMLLKLTKILDFRKRAYFTG